MEEKLVYTRTKTIQEDKVSGFCPGCMHGTVMKLIGEVIDELGIIEKTACVLGIGCCGLQMDYMAYDNITSPHGRACAVATGIKRTNPDTLVFTYQGDGDLASIGMAEIIHAAARGEKFTTFFINNGIYGMTGGQMAPTTLIGQRSTTSVDGRSKELTGMPLKISEMLATLDGAVYVERVALNSPANVRKAKAAVRRALDVQDKRLGFSFIEFLSTCPTNWGLTPADATNWVKEQMMPYYPLGIFKQPEVETK